MSKLIGLACLVLALTGGWEWYQQTSVGFSPAKIVSSLKHNSSWAIEEPSSDQLEKIFSQPFFYLRSGSQSYAFISQDGHYVIKFFRMKNVAPRWTDLVQPARADRRQQSLKALFGAYKLAYDKMKEDAGLLYLHLNKTSHLQKQLHVVDKMHRVHGVDLDQTEFIVQEKAELIFAHLQTLLDSHDEVGFKAAIQSVKDLVQRRGQKGISDRDHGVTNNFGFVGNRAIQIDIGRLYLTGQFEGDEWVCQRLDEWVSKNFYKAFASQPAR